MGNERDLRERETGLRGRGRGRGKTGREGSDRVLRPSAHFCKGGRGDSGRRERQRQGRGRGGGSRWDSGVVKIGLWCSCLGDKNTEGRRWRKTERQQADRDRPK